MRKTYIAAFAFTLLGVATLSNASPLFSESFENPNIDPNAYVTYNTSPVNFDNTWTLVGDADIIRGAYSPMPFPDGDQALDLNGWNPGTISTSVSTVAGSSYILGFWLSQNGGSGGLVEVSLDGAAIVPDFSSTNDMWVHYTHAFTASGSTLLQFKSLAPGGASGPTLDLITVDTDPSGIPGAAAVPVPAAAWSGLSVLGAMAGVGFIKRKRPNA